VTRTTPAPSLPVTRFAITPTPAQSLAFSFTARDLDLSPDGTHLVYTAGAAIIPDLQPWPGHVSGVDARREELRAKAPAR
jgi:hypothetical protein